MCNLEHKQYRYLYSKQNDLFLLFVNPKSVILTVLLSVFFLRYCSKWLDLLSRVSMFLLSFWDGATRVIKK